MKGSSKVVFVAKHGTFGAPSDLFRTSNGFLSLKSVQNWLSDPWITFCEQQTHQSQTLGPRRTLRVSKGIFSSWSAFRSLLLDFGVLEGSFRVIEHLSESEFHPLSYLDFRLFRNLDPYHSIHRIRKWFYVIYWSVFSHLKRIVSIHFQLSYVKYTHKGY